MQNKLNSNSYYILNQSRLLIITVEIQRKLLLSRVKFINVTAPIPVPGPFDPFSKSKLVISTIIILESLFLDL